jgi:hypothetical protein
VLDAGNPLRLIEYFPRLSSELDRTSWSLHTRDPSERSSQLHT